MEETRNNLREELREYKYEFGLLQRVPCSREENKKYKQLLKNGEKLPEGVYPTDVYNFDPATFHTEYETDLTDSEICQYLEFKKLSYLKSIKKYTGFVYGLFIFSIIAYFIIWLITRFVR